MENNPFESKKSMAEMMGVQGVTTPVRPDDFIHIQVHYLINLLRKQENEIKDYRIEEQLKDRVIDNLYASKAQPFKSVEQQLGKFFQPIINKLVIFRDEVLIDFRFNKSEGIKK